MRTDLHLENRFTAVAAHQKSTSDSLRLALSPSSHVAFTLLVAVAVKGCSSPACGLKMKATLSVGALDGLQKNADRSSGVVEDLLYTGKVLPLKKSEN
jgi:hypothetical protein